MRVDATNVKMSLNPGLVGVLADIHKASTRLGNRCQDDMDTNFTQFADGVAIYAAHTKRVDLEDPQQRENFNFRMLNTGGFFGISQTVFDAVFKGITMRKKAVDMLGATLFDLTLEIGFGKLQDMKKAKNAAGNAELMEQSMKEMQQEYVSKAMKGFEIKVSKLLQEAAQTVAKAQEALTAVIEAAGKAAQKADEHVSWILKRIQAAKDVPASAVKNWRDDFAHMMKLWGKQAELEKQLRSASKASEALEPLQKNLEELSSPGGDVTEKWNRLFGPGSPGEIMFEQARRECQAELEQLKQLKETDLAQWSAKIASLPPEFQGSALRHLEEAKRLSVALEKMDYFDGFMLDASKNMANAATQKLAQMHEIEQEQQARLNQGFFYSVWCSIWNFLSSVGSAIGNWISKGVEWVLGSFVTGLLAKAFGLLAWLITGFFWMIMEIFKYIAGFLEYIGRWRNPTYLEGEYRRQGQAFMVSLGVPEGHFYAEGQEEVIKGIARDADPDNLPDTVDKDKAAGQQLKADLQAKAKQQAEQQWEAEKNAYCQAVVAMCRAALDPSRLDKPGPVARYQEAKIRIVLGDIAAAMTSYEKQFQQCDGGFVDFVAMKADELLEGVDFSWASIANWLGMLGSQATLTARGVALALATAAPVTGGTSLAASAMIFAGAEVIDIVTVGARIVLCTLCVIPCVNAFAGDFMAMHAVAFEAMIRETENVPQPDLGVDPKTGVPIRLG